MKDIPIFTTENGAASLILKEIPYSKAAYIKLQHTLEPEKLLHECVDFCRMAGAEAVFAEGHPYLEQFPFHTSIWQMTRARAGLADSDASLFPVTEKTVEEFRTLYNRRMADVPNFSYMTVQDSKGLLIKGNGYFVHTGENLLGIGIASGDRIDGVIAVQPGAGETVVLALNHALSGETVSLEVASENKKAVRLYERLGFVPVQEISRWFTVLK